jgi:hypothetical protein
VEQSIPPIIPSASPNILHHGTAIPKIKVLNYNRKNNDNNHFKYIPSWNCKSRD